MFLFDHEIEVHVELQPVGGNAAELRSMVQSLPFNGGGTYMYFALREVLQSVSNRGYGMETWIVCLTDGESQPDFRDEFRGELTATPANVHMVAIGVNLDAAYEQEVRAMCQKYNDTADEPSRGFFVHADGSTAGMDRAFDVVKSSIPVSQTFERDGVLSDEDCWGFMTRYLPPFVEPHDMISQSFWIRFLFRRTQVFDNNQSFNFNEAHETLGSSLMEVMLSEVERLLSENQRREWLLENHAQLIYDFTIPDAPEFRLVCTAPDDLDRDLRQKLLSLDLPGFSIPTKADLVERVALDRFLSQALDLPLHVRDDGTEVLQCVDENNFILTLDFTMKLLNMHERVACRVPCLLEGETGVSKTALTKMYSILRNSAMSHKAKRAASDDLDLLGQQLQDEGYSLPASGNVEDRLREIILDGDGGAGRVLTLLQEQLKRRPSWFLPAPGLDEHASVSENALRTLTFFVSAVLETTFFEINVDSSLTEWDFNTKFDRIRAVADRLEGSDATVVVFLDGTYAL